MSFSEMRKLRKSLLFACLFIVIAGFQGSVFSDNHIDFFIGMGFPEFINIGMRYHASQMQFGLSYGFLPLDDEPCTSITGDIYFHFAGKPKHTSRKPWYSKFGLSYVKDKQVSGTSSYIYSNFRIGREFFISKKIGVGADVGFGIELSKEITETQETSSWFNFDLDFPIMPCISINIFYHIDV
ncbi:MAG: hypothetical protein JW794_00990 [Candidatus Cloacimonetes bacterium]|nr:hypothetical protein [Candidatus Cloacimonadota bacterium]